MHPDIYKRWAFTQVNPQGIYLEFKIHVYLPKLISIL